jgi:hypothetical protein
VRSDSGWVLILADGDATLSTDAADVVVRCVAVLQEIEALKARIIAELEGRG